MQCHGDISALCGAGNNVMVGDDVAGRIDNDTGATSRFSCTFDEDAHCCGTHSRGNCLPVWGTFCCLDRFDDVCGLRIRSLATSTCHCGSGVKGGLRTPDPKYNCQCHQDSQNHCQNQRCPPGPAPASSMTLLSPRCGGWGEPCGIHTLRGDNGHFFQRNA